MEYTGKQIEEILGHDIKRYLFMVSLISADTLVTEDDCDKSLRILNFIKDNVNIMNLEPETKTELLEYAIKGISIVSNEIEKIKNRK